MSAIARSPKATVTTTTPNRPGPHQPEVSVRAGELDGEPVVYVSLSGRNREEMILSASQWPEVLRRWGPHWLLIRGARLKDRFVVSTSLDVAREAGIRFPRLARLLTGAGHKQQVRHANGNTLDLRDSNLTLRTIGASRVRSARPPKTPKPGKPAKPKADDTPRQKKVIIGNLAEMALVVVRTRLAREMKRNVTDTEAVAYALCRAMETTHGGDMSLPSAVPAAS